MSDTIEQRVVRRFIAATKAEKVALEIEAGGDSLIGIMRFLLFARHLGRIGASRSLIVEGDSSFGRVTSIDGDGADRIGDIWLNGEKVNSKNWKEWEPSNTKKASDGAVHTIQFEDQGTLSTL